MTTKLTISACEEFDVEIKITELEEVILVHLVKAGNSQVINMWGNMILTIKEVK